jgi:hypothetical protein
MITFAFQKQKNKIKKIDYNGKGTKRTYQTQRELFAMVQ